MDSTAAVAATPFATVASLYAPLFGHFLVLSLLAVGGAIATTPEMHRIAVQQHGWLTDPQFAASIAIAQAAPGPNVLFVAVVGWHVAGLAGALVAMAGMMLPSTLLAVAAGRLGRRQGDGRAVRAVVAGLAPVTLGLVLSSAWILVAPVADRPGPVLLAAGAALLLARTSIAPLWLIAAGAVVGALGLA